jgi:hypothetical protein
MAGCSWVTVAVGGQLGSQLGYLRPCEPAGIQPLRRRARRYQDHRAAEPSSQ